MAGNREYEFHTLCNFVHAINFCECVCECTMLCIRTIENAVIIENYLGIRYCIVVGTDA